MDPADSPPDDLEGYETLFSALGEKIARDSATPDEAFAHCLSVSESAQFDGEQFNQLIAAVESSTGWKLVPTIH